MKGDAIGNIACICLSKFFINRYNDEKNVNWSNIKQNYSNKRWNQIKKSIE